MKNGAPIAPSRLTPPLTGRNPPDARRHDARTLPRPVHHSRPNRGPQPANYSHCAGPTSKCPKADRHTSTSAAHSHGLAAKGKSNRPRYYPPKTRAGIRRIPISPELVHALKTLEARLSADPRRSGFPAPTVGRMRRSNALRYGLWAALETRRTAAGQYALPTALHSHQRSFLGGAAVTEVQMLLGHSSPAITLKIYSHWFKAQDSGAVARLSDMILKPEKSGQKVDKRAAQDRLHQQIVLEFPSAERWPSGRRHQIANLAYWQRYRGFESLPLRQKPFKIKDFLAASQLVSRVCDIVLEESGQNAGGLAKNARISSRKRTRLNRILYIPDRLTQPGSYPEPQNLNKHAR